MRYFSNFRRALETLLITVACSVILGLSPAPVQADSVTLDLILGGGGATSWNVDNVKPGDYGIETVTLHNAGTSDGIVSIWISDIISSEGLNPESETGDKSGTGEFSNYLLISLEANDLVSNVSLPSVITDLPRSIYDSRYIRIPLNTGDTIHLDWTWVLPISAGNDAQGDSVSFTINYLLSDVIPTPPEPPREGYEPSLSPEPEPSVVEPPAPPKPAEPEVPVLETIILGKKGAIPVQEDGTILIPATITDESQTFTIRLESGTRITDGTGSLITRIELIIAEEFNAAQGVYKAPALANIPSNIVLLSSAYELKGYINDVEVPHIIFNQPVNLSIKYDPKNLPQNAFAPFIAYYVPEIGLLPIKQPPGAMFEVGTVNAQITYATIFVAAAKIAPPAEPLPPKFVIRDLVINPEEAIQGKPIKISLAIDNEGELKGSYELYVQVDGIVRAIKEVILPAQSTTELTFEITDLAPGTHQIKIAGLTGKVQIMRPASSSSVQPPVNWLLLDLAIIAVVLTGLLALYFFKRRARPLKL